LRARHVSWVVSRLPWCYREEYSAEYKCFTNGCTYESIAERGHWDRAELEVNPARFDHHR
jgi:hypothetical protein